MREISGQTAAGDGIWKADCYHLRVPGASGIRSPHSGNESVHVFYYLPPLPFSVRAVM
jgi:hypothetical protein